ncbi:cell wall-binding repeat-containing protein [Candidatus Oleimmundimicrobium sp.]|uniref:cell wall-binding repeat-containing protein n=1 Tax=Candidatus Oleimmundimicrobium sp. TaxID=3060597 RepID=UPI0027183AF8|nr:cell wall-binding repeat-containing protein [Candidatus Oleimmundimicrobium sp.]MDO8885283.1 cell wall-binding repeat-containing protein [Candidatus Oleimmundimicrobium sp.]
MKKISPKKRHLNSIAMMLVFLAVFIIPISANATEYYVLHEQGSGDGVGMCLAGARDMAQAGYGYTYRDILRKYYTSVIPSLAKENQSIRVGLYSTASTISISGSDGLVVFDDLENKLLTSLGKETIDISYDSEDSSYTIATPTKTLRSTSSYISISPNTSSILILENLSSLNYFRGDIETKFSSNSNSLWAINELPLNQYLYGLVGANDTWPRETLKALAVAARSYVLEKKQNADNPYKADGFDIKAITGCQYYLGYSYEAQIPNFKQAVDETAQEILTYDSKPISAAYHACCGGHTENNENVWGTIALPYLRGVPCGYCTWSSNYNWSLSIPANELQAKLNSNILTSVLGELRGFEILETGITPRVKTLRILGSNGSKDVSGIDFHNILKLKSTWFKFRPITRLAGSDRYKTAIEISKQSWNSAETVILTKGTDFPDALSGAPLAYKNYAPMLLVNSSNLTTETLDEIKRLGSSKAIILGGESAIPYTIDSLLISKGLTVKRLEGRNRYETAAKIALEVGSPSRTAIIATGLNYPDALSISCYAAYNQIPILLVNKDFIPDSTTQALISLDIKQTIIVGGTGAVSSKVEANLPNPLRIGGTDRYDTAKKIAERYFLYFPGSDNIFIATGENFPDALASASYAAKIGPCPILLTRNGSIPNSTKNYLINYSDDIKKLYITGGFGVISEEVQNELGSL